MTLRLRNLTPIVPPAARPPWRLLAAAGLTVGAVAVWTAGCPTPPDTAAGRTGPVSVNVEAPDPGVAVALDRCTRRREVVLAVLDGELRLLPAAARFRDLVAENSAEIGHVRRMYPGATDDERYARAIIRWVQDEQVRRRAGDSLGVRLEAELVALLAAGPLVLPEPADPTGS
jgi:hypothetical protein